MKRVKNDLGPELPYLYVVGALMYLANYTRLDIAFDVNLLVMYSSAPTQRHWYAINIYCATSNEQLIYVYFT